MDHNSSVCTNFFTKTLSQVMKVHTIPSFFLKLYIKVWMKVQLTQKEWEKFWIISTERGTKFPKRATKLCHTRNPCPRLAVCVHYGRFYEILSRNKVYGMCLFVLGTMAKVSNKNLKTMQPFCLLNQQNSDSNAKG